MGKGISGISKNVGKGLGNFGKTIGKGFTEAFRAIVKYVKYIGVKISKSKPVQWIRNKFKNK